MLGNIQTRVQAAVTWGEVSVTALPTDAYPDPALMVEVRFANQADADSFYNQADSFMGTGINGPVTGSTLTQHNCSHDQPGQPCTNLRERAW